MPVHEFQFAIEISGPGSSTDMLRDLTAQVLVHVGSTQAAADALVSALQGGLVKGAAPTGSRLAVRFAVDEGEFEIAVSSGARPIWRTTERVG